MPGQAPMDNNGFGPGGEFDPNDPTYANNPHYKWENGKWRQQVAAPGALPGIMPPPLAKGGPYWSDWNKNQLNRFNPTSTQPDFANQDQARQQQQNFIQQLHRLAQGDPNSLAQQQLVKSNQMAQGQMMGGIAARGNFGGAGAAMRQAAVGTNALQRGATDQRRVLMMQEQAAAQQALAQALAAQRGQDIGQAGMSADTALKNNALNDAMYQFYMNQGIGGDINRLSQNQDLAGGFLGFDQTGRALDRQFQNQLFGMGAGAVGTGASIYNKMNKNPIDEAFDG